MYSNIVVGSDGSDRSTEAVLHACELAARSGAVLHIVHAWDVSAAMAAMGDGAPDDHADALAALAERCGDQGVTAEVHIVRAEPADALIAVAEQVHADLLVVGNRGMSGIGRVLGSVPNKVSHHAPCSVLIVHTQG